MENYGEYIQIKLVFVILFSTELNQVKVLHVCGFCICHGKGWGMDDEDDDCVP